MDANQASSWLQLVQQFGLPLVLFFGLVALVLGAVYFLVRWARPRVDQLIDAVVGLINGQKEEQRNQSACLQRVGAELEDVREQLVALRGHTDHGKAQLDQVLSKLDRLLDRAARAT